MNTVSGVNFSQAFQPGTIQQPKPAVQFAGQNDGDQVMFGYSGGGNKAITIGGAVVAAIIMLLGGVRANMKVVDPTESCAITDTVTGNVRSAGPGMAFRPILLSKAMCFTTASTRVTEDPTVRSVEQVEVKVPVSIAWAPVAENIDKVYSDVYGPGGTNDPSLAPSLEQIKDKENQVLWENAVYSEFRGMIEEITSLVPASQIHTVAFKQIVADAILNGYNPEEVYNTFKPYQMRLTGNESEGPSEEVRILINKGYQAGLQERITDRYGADVIHIAAVTVRDTEILDQAYAAALQRLGQYPTLIREQEQQAELNRVTGEANNAAALAQRQVELTQADTRREVAEKDAATDASVALTEAEAQAAVTLTEAEAEAQAVQIINKALEEGISDEFIEYLRALGFQTAAENGNLIITDGNTVTMVNSNAE